MEALRGSELLRLWERGRCLHPLDQGLLALQTAAPGSTGDEVAGLPLGERNRRLLELRTACAGTVMSGWIACPACGEKLEFDLDARDLAEVGAVHSATVHVAGSAFRLPTSRDVALAARETDPNRALQRVLELCRLGPASDARESSPQEIDVEIDEVGTQMALADPLAEPQLELACTGCGHAWEEPLDIGSFLWTEIDVQVRRLLHEVHALASAYGWSEAEILSLTDERRSLYVEMVRA
jgi:hypothetical protein